MGRVQGIELDSPKLKALIKEKGYTTKTFADATGISPRTLEDYISARSGRNKTYPNNLKLMALVLGVDTDDLVKKRKNHSQRKQPQAFL